MDKRISFFILILILSGCIGQEPAPVQTETPASSPIPTEPPKPNAIVEYAKDKLSQEIIALISPADKDGILDEVEKSVVDDLKMLPEEKYRKIASQEVMKDTKLTKEDVTFLAKYSNSISKSIKEMEDLKNDNFTLKDGVQTDLEKRYLENQKDQRLAEELRNDYLDKIKMIYPELASELKKLPEFVPLKIEKKSLEALEDIYGLLLTAEPYKNYNDRFKSNIPKENETWEAFELMIAGGTPDPKDYQYAVPNYNTELQALLWIAEQNEFHHNDTLAQAIAMVNGLWVTMGDDEVRKAVKKDTNDLLNYFRETNEWQRERGFNLLEGYSLEAKTALAWIGNESAAGFGENRPHRLFDYRDKKLGLRGYKWNTVEVKTLVQMRELMVKNKWISGSVDETVANLEFYFYFNMGSTVSSHWNYTNPVRAGAKEEYIFIDGERVLNHGHQNVDFMFKYYMEHDMGIGSCLDEEAYMDSWNKSWGIATIGLWLNPKGEGEFAHNYVSYFEPKSKSWRAYNNQLKVVQGDSYIYIYKLPIQQRNFLWTGALKENPNRWDGGMVYIIKNLSIDQFELMFTKGVPTSQMKQWLLYS